jgi:hypothetical protein
MAIQYALGLLGAYCTSCTIKESEGKDPERIRLGFTMDRHIDSLHTLHSDLVDESGRIRSRPEIMVHVRASQTSAPMTREDITKVFPVLHAWIRILCMFESLIYRINADYRRMGKGKRQTREEKQRLKKAKADFQEGAKYTLSMKLDCPFDNFIHL